MSLNIKAVAELTGVPLHTLRAWERRYGIPRPDRNAENRYRLYDDQDVADVMWMKRQVEAGVSPAQASAMLRQGSRTLAVQPVVTPAEASANALYEAFCALDEIAAQRILNEAWSAYAPEQVILDVIQPTMRRIGEGWQRNLLSVEQEHFASNLIRQRLHSLIQAQASTSLTAPRLVAACAPEEQHDLGLLMLTLIAKRQGWNVTYLGQRTPLDELKTASVHARYCVVSVSTVTGLASLLPLWMNELPAAPILFGGDIFSLVPGLRQHVPGAYLGSDGVDALRNLAMRQPRVSEWRPETMKLETAFELQAMRLQLASEAVTQYLGRPKTHAEAYNEMRGTMSHAALYLTDILSCAFGFDAPEMMQVHGAWLYELLTPRHVPSPALHQFLDVYRANVKRLLAREYVKPVNEMIQRFAAAVDTQIGVNAQ